MPKSPADTATGSVSSGRPPRPGGRKTAGSASRRRNEEAILDAFERVVARDGIRGLGPTAIMKEAGLGKPLLYRYFGDLAGLIEAWGSRRRMWPEAQALAGEETVEMDPKLQLKAALDAVAGYLYQNPVRLEILAEELTPDSAVSPALHAVRRGTRRHDEEVFRKGHPLRERENFRLNHVLYAAIVYFALRSRTSPELQGIQLDTAEGWQDTMAMMHKIIEDAMLASQFRRLLALAGGSQRGPWRETEAERALS